LSERPDRDLQQDQWVVVTRRAIQMDDVTTVASVNEDPLPVATYCDRDRLHERVAERSPITRALVQVAAPQTVRAMVAVSGADGEGRDVQAAMTAAERVLHPTPLTAALIVRHRKTSRKGRWETPSCPGVPQF
jgi:hypothetical protein